MIRVLQCVHGMNRGGLETFIMNVYRNIDRARIQFDFLVHTDDKCDFDDEIVALGGNIFSIPSRHSGLIKNRKALDEFFRRHKEYKIVHMHSSSLSYVEPLRAAKKYNVPIRIIHSHSTQEGGSFIHKYIHKWNQLFIKLDATHHIACSDLAGEWMYGKKIRNSNSYKIINNGIKTNQFLFSREKRQKVREKLGVSGKFVIGHIGRLTYPKNHEFLIEIFNIFHKMDSNSLLLLVGEGELRSQIEQKIKKLNLENSVILTGKRDDIADLLQGMDIFIFPSHFEGLPVTLVEAQTAGLPCIVSDNITKQVKITDNIVYEKLESSISVWVERILDIKKNYLRKNERENIVNAGFDIDAVTNEMQKIYLKCN
ncbi:glycosyltransferase family 1 protein [Paenibacillus sp. N4]|uniref:glycosyltransferase family 1 protein n=1 Tax=Paenibacillus vietnamensis TaxID=2590547 RepID=UPI001CD0E903|nr:glycosyltransferase family 1 protein [Paenibacillus vietnamensis]MCA0756493.1 glycosyltransferase family 1 protein [Paenibacillus vietnamensis]